MQYRLDRYFYTSTTAVWHHHTGGALRMVEVGLGEVTKLPSTKYLRGLSHARIPARWVVLLLLKLILCQRAGGFRASEDDAEF